MALTRLCECIGWSEPELLSDAISTKMMGHVESNIDPYEAVSFGIVYCCINTYSFTILIHCQMNSNQAIYMLFEHALKLEDT